MIGYQRIQIISFQLYNRRPQTEGNILKNNSKAAAINNKRFAIRFHSTYSQLWKLDTEAELKSPFERIT